MAELIAGATFGLSAGATFGQIPALVAGIMAALWAAAIAGLFGARKAFFNAGFTAERVLTSVLAQLLATTAFLAAARFEINDFFWIAIMFSSPLFF